SRALGLIPEEAAANRMLAARGRGLMRYRIGRYGDALADLEVARTLGENRAEPRVQVDILLDQAIALDWMNEYRRAADKVAQARALAAGLSDPVLGARLALREGRAHQLFSRYEEAETALRQAIAGAEPLGDAGYETLIIALLILSHLLPVSGKIDEAEAVCER